MIEPRDRKGHDGGLWNRDELDQGRVQLFTGGDVEDDCARKHVGVERPGGTRRRGGGWVGS